MKWVVIIFAIFGLSACKNHQGEVGEAINTLERVSGDLGKIGEERIPNYHMRVFEPNTEYLSTQDSISISYAEYYQLLSDIDYVKEELQSLSRQMEKQYESE